MEASRDEHGSGASRGRGEPVWCARLTVSELTHRERCAGSGVGIGDPDSRPPVGRNADFGQSGRTSCRIELNVDDATRPQLGATRLARSS